MGTHRKRFDPPELMNDFPGIHDSLEQINNMCTIEWMNEWMSV